jgi:hypothetical protein
MRCKCCGRPLKDAESIEAGIGPVCRKRKCGADQIELAFPPASRWTAILIRIGKIIGLR